MIKDLLGRPIFDGIKDEADQLSSATEMYDFDG